MLKIKESGFQLAAGLVPVAFSFGAIFGKSAAALLLCAASLFCIVAILPLCRRRENLYMFLFVTAAGLPLNLYAIWWLYKGEWFFSELAFSNVIIAFIIFFTMFCIEQLLFGFITRLIWKRQYAIKC